MNPPRHPALEPMARVIAQQLAHRPEHFITHPSELKIFHALSDDSLREFAHDHGWRVVRRVGGRQIEFYNDAEMRWRALRAGLLSPNEASNSLGVRPGKETGQRAGR